jgi:hypothetical protein
MQLSDEQIEAAAKAMFNAFHPADSREDFRWEWDKLTIRTSYLNAARAAATFLHVRWEMPTPSELKAFQGRLMEQGGSHIPWQHLTLPFNKFIAERNASIIPKPVDPRRDKIMTVLKTGVMNPGTVTDNCAGFIADRILVALDAKE